MVLGGAGLGAGWGDSEMLLPFVCVQARCRFLAGVWGMVVGVRDVPPRLCWCPSHPQLLSAAPPRFLAPKSRELGQLGLFPSSLPLAEQWKHPV